MTYSDECHHAASDTIANVLKEAKAKYVYGVTVTPKRGDRLEKINFMLLGHIRYSYTAKEKAKSQGIAHLVYPRFTCVVAPRGIITEKMHPNEAYDIIHNNEMRDEMILIATGPLIGEGFDYPRLDTLFMATPVSFRSVVE